LCRFRIALVVVHLMPIGIGRSSTAGLIKSRDLFFSEIPSDRAEVGQKLRFVAGTDYDVGNGGATQKPIERDLRD
jgi:hypothetical protein